MVTLYTVPSCYQGVFYWFTSKHWKNSKKSLCTSILKKTGQSNLEGKNPKIHTTTLTCIQLLELYLRFLQVLLSCHTLSRSCNAKLWLPTGWQFLFHLGFQTVKNCLLYFLTPPRPASVTFLCYAAVRQRDALLQPRILHDARMCNLEGLWLIQAQDGMCFIRIHKARQILPVQSIQKSIASCRKHQWNWTVV